MNELKIKNYIIADYDIINRGIDSLFNDDEKHIMQKGELEDYYKKYNFEEEFTGISGKGIIAYKIAELASTQGIDKYIETEEYKEILSNILG